MNARLDIVPSGYFQAVGHIVGTTDEEIVAMAKGDVDPARVKIVADNLLCAALRLSACVPLGRC